MAVIDEKTHSDEGAGRAGPPPAPTPRPSGRSWTPSTRPWLRRSPGSPTRPISTASSCWTASLSAPPRRGRASRSTSAPANDSTSDYYYVDLDNMSASALGVDRRFRRRLGRRGHQYQLLVPPQPRLWAWTAISHSITTTTATRPKMRPRDVVALYHVHLGYELERGRNPDQTAAPPLGERSPITDQYVSAGDTITIGGVTYEFQQSRDSMANSGTAVFVYLESNRWRRSFISCDPANALYWLDVEMNRFSQGRDLLAHVRQLDGLSVHDRSFGDPARQHAGRGGQRNHPGSGDRHHRHFLTGGLPAEAPTP